ncbi:MAG: oxidoreductase [Deltaproteobacteria bacterium]|nr:oxidoreductase [Deltaproteobacteria bacterium]
MVGTKKRLSVHKLASCDGCQLNLLNVEDELLALADAVELAYFPEASSAMRAGPWDLSLVEGSIITGHDLDRLRQIREDSRFLVAIGACATSGGVQALRAYGDLESMVSEVYARPEYVRTLATSTPPSAHVKVDFELRGCPVNERQLLELVSAYLFGRSPRISSDPVCTECKRRGEVCVTVSRGLACLGPVTHAGCGALCPAYGRGCFGCFGPSDAAATTHLARRLLELGVPPDEVLRLFRSFNSTAPAFVEGARALGVPGSTK